MGGVEVPQAPRGVGRGEEVSLPTAGRVCVASLPKNFSYFFVENTIFWRILTCLFLKSYANEFERGSNAPNPLLGTPLEIMCWVASRPMADLRVVSVVWQHGSSSFCLATSSPDSAQAQRISETVALLTAETPEFISPLEWPPNSPDLNPVDYTRFGGFFRSDSTVARCATSNIRKNDWLKRGVALD